MYVEKPLKIPSCKYTGASRRYSFNRLFGRTNESSGRPLLFVPGRLHVLISLFFLDTRRWGYSIFRPSKQLAFTRSPVEKKGCWSAFSAVSRFSGSYSWRPDSSLYPSDPKLARLLPLPDAECCAGDEVWPWPIVL